MIDISAIRAREQAATPGPWESGHYESVSTSNGTKLLNTIRQADADFIAHARTDIPALLAEIATLTARAKQAEAALRDAERRAGCEYCKQGEALAYGTDSMQRVGTIYLDGNLLTADLYTESMTVAICCCPICGRPLKGDKP